MSLYHLEGSCLEREKADYIVIFFLFLVLNVGTFADHGTNPGKYLQAEVDGGFSRDVLEFLVKGGATVTYRAMATKVTYVYPFTTAFGDSKGQEERMKQIVQRLGWYAPNLDFED